MRTPSEAHPPAGDLLARLRQVDPPGDGQRTRWYRNPDGPEAAAEIERLQAALRMIAGEASCPDNLLGNADIARIALYGR